MNPLIKRPNGLPEISATFGFISNHVDDSGVLSSKWEHRMATYRLPFAITLDWDRGVKAKTVRLHSLVLPFFEMAINKIYDKNLESQIKTWGGGYIFRKNRVASDRYSTHCWGISFDINCFENAQGTPGNMSQDLVAIFEEFGFFWGGLFKNKPDPMHFQFCTGY